MWDFVRFITSAGVGIFLGLFLILVAQILRERLVYRASHALLGFLLAFFVENDVLFCDFCDVCEGETCAAGAFSLKVFVCVMHGSHIPEHSAGHALNLAFTGRRPRTLRVLGGEK